jgi:hypothetical protein
LRKFRQAGNGAWRASKTELRRRVFIKTLVGKCKKQLVLDDRPGEKSAIILALEIKIDANIAAAVTRQAVIGISIKG